MTRELVGVANSRNRIGGHLEFSCTAKWTWPFLKPNSVPITLFPTGGNSDGPAGRDGNLQGDVGRDKMWNKDFMAAINFPGLHLFDAAGPGMVVVLSARRWSPLISCCGVMGLPCISRFAFNDPIDRTAYSNRESAPNYPDLIYLRFQAGLLVPETAHCTGQIEIRMSCKNFRGSVDSND